MFKTIEDCEVLLISRTALVEGVSKSSEDFLPANAARASFSRQDKTGDDPTADSKLIRYLADHEHMTPFEYQHCVFLIECPLFIRSQIMRHRTFSYSEVSRRYTSENLEFWIPDKWRKQSKSNKQASTDEELMDCQIDPCVYSWRDSHEECLELYEDYLAGGLCREQARAVLPQSLLTRFYMGGNLRNWVHFLKLRLDDHAQYEVRVIAQRIEKQLRELWPVSMEALMGE